MQSDAADQGWIDGRYRLDGVLGRGGMSTVYRAWDAREARSCALKFLDTRFTERLPKLPALFQREYATLGQLAHPSIVEVYDYGLDGERPYYTMELLEGNDLRRLAPLPWRTVCRLLREVASALALLHSRRLIHRDVTAANVHCTADGRAKLMDFGAMTDMGVASHVVGTPPYIAPEALHGQPLDERVDLFALGALAYHVLTGRNAFPANTMTQLHASWRARPAPPSALIADVPAGLDQLVMALLSLDARARPGSAAEVIERLTALADLARDSRLETAHAYLITPPLIGRERELQLLRERLSLAQRGEGSALLFEAGNGMGKSRMLETFALEARQSGALALHVSGESVRGQDFALLREIARSVFEAAPELALRSAREHGAVLGHVLPDLHAAQGRPQLLAFDSAKQRDARVQAAALAWLREIASEQWLAIAVDEIQDADAPSLLLLVELAREASALTLQIAAAAGEAGEARTAKLLEWLRAACACVPLTPLDRSGCEALVRALFGDVGNVKLVASWADEVAQGNPQAILDLAQHLVDSGVALYDNGRWSLGPDLAQHVLPRSLTDAHHSRLRALPERERVLAEALALATQHAPLDVGLYPELLPSEPALRVYAALDELVARRFVVASGMGHVFVHRELRATVAASVPQERAQPLYAALAALERKRGQWLQAAHYLQRAGEDRAALELVLKHIADDSDPTSRGFALTPAGIELFANTVRAAERFGCSPQQAYFLARRMLQLSAYVDIDTGPIAERLLSQLRSDTGLDLFDTADPDPAQYATRCFPRAQARYDALPEAQRGLPPLEAVRELAHAVVALSGAYGRVLDIAGMRKLHAMLLPLRTLVPVVTLLHDITAGAIDRLCGRRFSDSIDDVLARLEGGVPGLDEVTRGGARRTLTYYLALEQAQLCNPKVLAYADFIAEDPVHEALAWHLRAVKHLYSGDAARARACRDRTELIALRQPEGFAQLATSVLYETEARALGGDLLALKEALPRLDQLADRSPGFRGFARTVHAEYELLRGRGEHACEQLADVLAHARPGESTEWSRAVSSYVEALLRCGELDRAIAQAEHACEQSRALRLNPLYPVMLSANMALALARRGDGTQARDEMQLALEEAQALGMDGVPLGRLHEAAARIASCLGDDVALARHAAHARLQYTRGGDAQLIARYQRLVGELGRVVDAPRAVSQAAGTDTQVTAARGRRPGTSASRSLDDTNGLERIVSELWLVLEHSGAAGACVFGLAGARPALVARCGACDPEAVASNVAQYAQDALLAQAGEPTTQEMTRDVARSGALETAGAGVRPLLLSAMRDQCSVVAGVLVLWDMPEGSVPPWPLIADLSEAVLAHGTG
jgi:hypothetical protein